jgi:hypothetical protein
MHRHNRSFTRPLVAAALLLAFGDCTCDPASTEVNPDCPGGLKATASLVVTLDSTQLRPIGSPKRMRIRGNRTDRDACFANGAQSSFSVELSDPSTLSATQSTLAPGNWHFTVVALSGGDYSPIEQDRALSPGSHGTLKVAGDANQNIVVTFTGT